ncbi:MAG: 4Fe-4S dicluster domain-containing protein, partial [Chloroflexota bacterium]|nr:4Fe-4S dicluster domain-containing protein [Chloroflexota bacterium]
MNEWTRPASLAQRIRAETGKNVFVCYQCRECESLCPLAFWFDVPPPRLLQDLQRGETDRVLKSRTPWLCASCKTCATQCPHRLDLARLMSALT